MRATVAALALTVTLIPARPAWADLRAVLAYDTGPAYIAQNDGRYGAAGTPYEADDVGQRDTLVRAERATVELVAGRHRVIALYAPFLVDTQATLTSELRFRDVTFPTGTVVDHRYRFDGYRASYLYQVVGGRVGLELGGSLQVRSADVAFASADGSRRASQSDIGLVPALKARLTYTPGRAWAQLEADARRRSAWSATPAARSTTWPSSAATRFAATWRSTPPCGGSAVAPRCRPRPSTTGPTSPARRSASGSSSAAPTRATAVGARVGP